jgi:hypothetical protein
MSMVNTLLINLPEVVVVVVGAVGVEAVAVGVVAGVRTPV